MITVMGHYYAHPFRGLKYSRPLRDGYRHPVYRERD
jgi:hypothetical protein